MPAPKTLFISDAAKAILWPEPEMIQRIRVCHQADIGPGRADLLTFPIITDYVLAILAPQHLGSVEFARQFATFRWVAAGGNRASFQAIAEFLPRGMNDRTTLRQTITVLLRGLAADEPFSVLDLTLTLAPYEEAVVQLAAGDNVPCVLTFRAMSGVLAKLRSPEPAWAIRQTRSIDGRALRRMARHGAYDMKTRRI